MGNQTLPQFRQAVFHYSTRGSKQNVHPLAKPAIQHGTAIDKKSEKDGNLYTAQDENTVWAMMPAVIKALE